MPKNGEREPRRDNVHPAADNGPSRTASSLAGMFLEEQVRKGRTIEVVGVTEPVAKVEIRRTPKIARLKRIFRK